MYQLSIHYATYATDATDAQNVLLLMTFHYATHPTTTMLLGIPRQTHT